MEVINGEDIINALNVIKKVCKDNCGNCKLCPMEVMGSCAVQDLEPCNWKVLEYTKFQALG